MANVAFDTLTASKDLQRAGIEIQQAEAIALVIKDSQGDLATKSDIEQVRSEIQQLRSETKSDIEQLRSEVKSDIEQLRSEVKSDIEQVRSEIQQLKSDIIWLKWSMAVMMAVMLGGFGTIVSLLP